MRQPAARAEGGDLSDQRSEAGRVLSTPRERKNRLPHPLAFREGTSEVRRVRLSRPRPVEASEARNERSEFREASGECAEQRSARTSREARRGGNGIPDKGRNCASMIILTGPSELFHGEGSRYWLS